MNTLTWIFAGLLAVVYFLFIFGTIKEINIMGKISRAFIMPFSAAIVILFLNQYLPLTRHIMFLSIIALSLCSLSQILFIFSNIKSLNLIGRLFFFLSLMPWIELYITTFHLYKIPTWIYIVCGTIYAILLILTLIFTGKNKFSVYLYITIAFTTAVLLNFSSIVSLINDFRLNYGLLTGGSLIILFAICAYGKQTTKPVKINKKLETILGITIITLAECLISTSGLLMVI